MSDDTPTQRFDAPSGGASEEVVEERKSRKLMIILGIVGGALLLTVIILLIFLVFRPFENTSGLPTGSPTPTRSGSASPTPTQSDSASPTPSPTPTPTQTTQPTQPPSNNATINAFDVSNSEVVCNEVAPGGPFPIYIDFSWSSSNVNQVFFGVNTNDASQAPFFDNLPPSGTSQDFPSGYYPFEYQCGAPSIKYTITVVGSNGSKDSASVTVENTGDEY